jgi:hypothetical protein
MKSQPRNQPNSGRVTLATSLRECALGTVQSVDPLGREISVLLPTGRAVFYVPSDCPTYLRGERIKLRIVQPGDEVRVTFVREGGVLFAKALEVRPPADYSLESGGTRNILPGVDHSLPKSPLA